MFRGSCIAIVPSRYVLPHRISRGFYCGQKKMDTNQFLGGEFGVSRLSDRKFEDTIEAVKKDHAAAASVLIPKFSNVEEERKHNLIRLVAGYRLFAKYGFDEGVAGHITVRDPEHKDTFWVNSYGTYFGNIKVKDLIRVSSSGEVVEGKGHLNKAAFAIHSAIHDARPDVVAAAHSHSMYGKVWSTTGRLLQPITQDSCGFYNQHVLSEDFTGVVYNSSEGESIAKNLGQKKGIILRNHGLVAVGNTVEGAIWNYISFERACQAQVMAEMVNKDHLKEIDPETAELTYYQTGSPFASWFQFQPLYQMIVKEQKDILE